MRALRDLGVTLFWTVSLTLSGCDFSWTGPTATTHCVATAELSAGDAVEIESRNGSVRVSMDPALAQAEIEADIRCGGSDLEHAQARAELAQIAALRSESSGRLRIEPAFPEGILKRDAASFVVRLPYATEIRIKTSNGAVVVQGADAAPTGNVTAVTSNAPMDVRDIDGDVVLDSSNGGVVVARVGGSVRAETSNAPVHVKDAAGEVTVDTSNGSIVFEGSDLHPGPISLDTSNAPIAATLGPQFLGRLDLDTSNARICVDDVAGRIVEKKLRKSGGYVVIGEGSTVSRCDTSNGSITVEVH